MQFKTCSRCGVEKIAADFFASKADRSGLQSWCKACQRTVKAADAREKYRALTPDEKETVLESVREHRRANKPQFAAYAAKQRESQWVKYLLGCAHRSNRAKSKTPLRKVELTEQDIIAMFKAQGGSCYWFGIPMVPSGTKRDPHRPSIDRLDCSKGYTRDNVVLCCMAANFARCDMPAETFRQFVSFLFEHARSRVA